MSAVARIELDSRTLARASDAKETALLRAGVLAVQMTTRALEQDLERAFRAAGLGRLGSAWTSALYPAGDMGAYRPRGVVYGNGRARTTGALAAYVKGAEIRNSTSGQWLAIPTPEAGALPRNRNLTPGEWERRTGRRLRFVYLGVSRALLVADQLVNARSGPGLRPATARRLAQGRAVRNDVVIFVLVPLVRVAQRVDGDSLARAQGDQLEARLKQYSRAAREAPGN